MPASALALIGRPRKDCAASPARALFSRTTA